MQSDTDCELAAPRCDRSPLRIFLPPLSPQQHQQQQRKNGSTCRSDRQRAYSTAAQAGSAYESAACRAQHCVGAMRCDILCASSCGGAEPTIARCCLPFCVCCARHASSPAVIPSFSPSPLPLPRFSASSSSSSPDRVQTLIIGSGPCGLGAAWRLEELARLGLPRAGEWTLVDAAPHSGGLASSVVDPQGFTSVAVQGGRRGETNEARGM